LTEKQQKSRYQGVLKSIKSSRGQNRENWDSKSKRKKKNNHVINMKKGFVLRKRKVYLLFREEREKICKFIDKQLKKRYVKSLKLSQTAPVFFVGNKGSKK